MARASFVSRAGKSPFATSFRDEEFDELPKKQFVVHGGPDPERLPRCSESEKMLMIAVVAVLVTVGILVLVLLLDEVAVAEQRSICRDLDSRMREGESMYGINTTVTINDLFLCNSIKCSSFDIMQCQNLCPFGYKMDANDCPVSCECAAEGVMEGDMRFDEFDVTILLDELGYEKKKRFSVFGSKIRFPVWRKRKGKENVTIPYILDHDLTREQIDSWRKAIGQLNNRTCVQFKRREKEMDFLSVTKTTHHDCSSYIGRKGGRQNLTLGDCYAAHHVEHMLMHTLGFQHEHGRSDRDAYIEIKWDNILPGHELKFRKERDRKRPYHTGFDKYSVTMFTGYSYSIADNKPTIVDVDTKQVIVAQDSVEFSDSDIFDIKSRYCKKKPQKQKLGRGRFAGEMETQISDLTWGSWGAWSHCDVTCGRSSKNRYRLCQDGSGTEQPGSCPGTDVDVIRCNNIVCPERTGPAPSWGPWTQFGKCSRSCGTGVRYRLRQCSDGKKNRSGCTGSTLQGVECNTYDCASGTINYLDPWTEWSECSRSCGGGLMERFRECKDMRRKRARNCNGIVENDGLEYQSKICDVMPCPGGKTGADFYSNSMASKYLEEPRWFSRSLNSIPTTACHPASSSIWIVGDFNGDRRQDILCENPREEVKIVIAGKGEVREVSWEGKLKNCRRPMIYAGDFNGDRTSDILCIAADGVDANILIFPGKDGTLEAAVKVGSFCLESEMIRYIVDVDGDGKDDVICRDPAIRPDANSTVYFNIWS